jgi:hypothetical protein
MQLDAFLESARRHAGHVYETVTVLYRPTSGPYNDAYESLRRARKDVRWLAETRFSHDLRSCIDGLDETVFHTDDDVFFRPFERPTVADDEACFTLRLGLNTTYCYPLDSADEIRAPQISGDRVTWAWRDQEPGAFAYPLALNGHVFRTDELRGWLDRIEFGNPNELESALQTLNDEVRPRMASFRESCVVSIPANLVNETFANRNSGSYDVTVLNERFLAGERIDLDAMDFSAVGACHQEIDYVFTTARAGADRR